MVLCEVVEYCAVSTCTKLSWLFKMDCDEADNG